MLHTRQLHIVVLHARSEVVLQYENNREKLAVYNPNDYKRVLKEMFVSGEYRKALSGRDGYVHIDGEYMVHDHLLVLGELFRWLGGDKDRCPVARAFEQVIELYIAQDDGRYLILFMNSWKFFFRNTSLVVSRELPVDWKRIDREMSDYLLRKHKKRELSIYTFTWCVMIWLQVFPELRFQSLLREVDASPEGMPESTNYREIL